MMRFDVEDINIDDIFEFYKKKFPEEKHRRHFEKKHLEEMKKNMKYYELLHKKRIRVVMIGHRGLGVTVTEEKSTESNKNPDKPIENTIESFKEVIILWSHGIEFDVFNTKGNDDDSVVVIHEDKLAKRILKEHTDEGKIIGKMINEDIKGIKLKNDTRIPKLIEVLQLVEQANFLREQFLSRTKKFAKEKGKLQLIVEIKDNTNWNDGYRKKVIDKVINNTVSAIKSFKDYANFGNVYFSSFNRKALKKLAYRMEKSEGITPNVVPIFKTQEFYLKGYNEETRELLDDSKSYDEGTILRVTEGVLKKARLKEKNIFGYNYIGNHVNSEVKDFCRIKNKNLFVYFSRCKEYSSSHMFDLMAMGIRLSCENKELRLYFICDDVKAAMDEIEKLDKELKSLSLSLGKEGIIEKIKLRMRDMDELIFDYKNKKYKQSVLEQVNNQEKEKEIAEKNNPCNFFESPTSKVRNVPN